jgi:hypothetical protein
MNGLNIENASIVSCVVRSKLFTDFCRSETILPMRPPPQSGEAFQGTYPHVLRVCSASALKLTRMFAVSQALLPRLRKPVGELASVSLSSKWRRLYSPHEADDPLHVIRFESPDDV